MGGLWEDGEEYKERMNRPFVPSDITIKQINEIVPKECFERSAPKAIWYWSRDVMQSLIFWYLATRIQDVVELEVVKSYGGVWGQTAVWWVLWVLYWVFQSISFAGMWLLGHEAGHDSLSDYKWLNQSIGFTLHSWVLTPYYSWKYSHQQHHKATGHMTRDEIYVPALRSEKKGLPPAAEAEEHHYMEAFDDAPIVTGLKFMTMQLIGYPLYLAYNLMGSPDHPPGTNHYEPTSAIFKKGQGPMIILSDIGIGATISILTYAGYQTSLKSVLLYYFIPYLLTNHWVVMVTYLQHSDPTIPHYRDGQWNFVRGANSSIDRDMFGNFGRFFFHNASQDHIAHHYFCRIPFWNAPKATEALKKALGDDYNFDSTPGFYALWRSFSQCTFVEDTGDIVFYKDKRGRAKREVAPLKMDKPPVKPGDEEAEKEAIAAI